jgi:hypothetical protein
MDVCQGGEVIALIIDSAFWQSQKCSASPIGDRGVE